jgi:uncharacterized protein YdhG (YjbR/CyaY superfamily)
MVSRTGGASATLRKSPKTIAEYIATAPPATRSHLRDLYRVLKDVAPHADEVIKWGAPFFVDPRFIYSFAAFKAHCVLAPTPAALAAFEQELKGHQTTLNYLKIPYDKPVPIALIRRIAKYRLAHMGDRDTFW